MAQEKSSTEARPRGRPQLRSDDETRKIVFDTARHAFAANGFAATSTEELARGAGISTKTLYRLFPNKAALFEAMVADRLDRELSDVQLRGIDHADIEEGLRAALLACADIALDPDVVALQRIVLQESAGFPDLASAFYRNGIARTAAALARWLRVQVKRERIRLDNAEEAAGMLIGMVASAPQRAAIYGGVPLPSRKEVERRVRTVAALFLDGCRVAPA
ncbi:TetR/AcrR family transcriptional regulator [Bradyrhizobium manausense]|uniref:TetR/AcrR family transcriptional regulator n=1 Tax=Bradyrhizobium TaxID=374 RepID=UPI001BAB47BD|nr:MULTISPECIES: TetR/AcrR family transcriptional regulator [Bradyrhizobium]MBR0829235.1 TetR/AcrR family transcriptional regulator [Bradyrhizobium manausense]UVO29835.1 TetR/AcrR family transcriptional regulator [Bradyrhizobium arachidis]